MPFVQVYSVALLVILGCMLVLWLVSLRLKNSSIADVFWGLGFVIATWIYFCLSPDGFPLRKWLVSILVTLWGLRLSLYLLGRNWGGPEDFRYRVWRKKAGARWGWRSLFKVFLQQGFLIWIISAPLLAAQQGAKPAHLILFDFLVVGVWGLGFFLESVGDFQLARFKADPANEGKIMDRGLWRWTRHPNYFGDSLQWWGFFMFAAFTGGWWTIFSPILMTLLLLRVSGVVHLERTLKTRPGYMEYIQKTSAFIPWLPRKK
jgi:steroid 5-alpha reductase family enzyme